MIRSEKQRLKELAGIKEAEVDIYDESASFMELLDNGVEKFSRIQKALVAQFQREKKFDDATMKKIIATTTKAIEAERDATGDLIDAYVGRYER